jgi:hypothetical protein
LSQNGDSGTRPLDDGSVPNSDDADQPDVTHLSHIPALPPALVIRECATEAVLPRLSSLLDIDVAAA